MRVAVIRADLPAPLFLADLEQVSRRNDPVDAPGQEKYISPPTEARITAALGHPATGVGATITGSGAPTSLTLGAGNKVLRLKTSAAASFGAYTIAEAAYASTDALVTAINRALAGAGVQAFRSGLVVVLESQTYGVNSYLELDTSGNGSTANTTLNLASGVRTMPPASAYLTAAGLPDGPMTLGQANMEAVGSGTSTRALEPFYDALSPRALVVADAIAPIFAETDVAVESFLVGMLSQYRNENYDPDPHRSSVPTGAAVAVFEDDGATAFATANTLPTIVTGDLGTPSEGMVTISGTGLGNENGGGTYGNGVVVKFTGPVPIRLEQKAIIHGGGSVLPGAIVIPAALVPGLAVTASAVQVQVRHRLSNVVVLT